MHLNYTSKMRKKDKDIGLTTVQYRADALNVAVKIIEKPITVQTVVPKWRKIDQLVLTVFTMTEKRTFVQMQK